MATYSTLEEIKTGMQDDLFADDLITLRSEQRDAIDQAVLYVKKLSPLGWLN